MNALTVFLASASSTNPHFINMIDELARLLAEQKTTLIYGGSKAGLMGQLASATLKAGGTVYGVFSENLGIKDEPHPELTKLIRVKSFSERIELMQQLGDGIMVLPGGLGTLEELFTVWNQIRLGLFHKPLGILNIDHFYSRLQQFLIADLQKEQFIIDAWLTIPLIHDNVTALYEQICQRSCKTL